MKCPHCQAENPEGSEYCRRCGQSLRLELVCPRCGHTNLPDSVFCNKCGHTLVEEVTKPLTQPYPEPTSFASGRYQVKRFLGEGGKKKVYLVHDTELDRDVAFALIKTENLNEDARKRVTREAKAIGRLGDNPHIVAIFDIGEENGQPYIIQPNMSGGDVEELIEKAPDHKLPLDQVIGITKSVCQGLEFAHSKGIIHRDIKPGNVLLTEDGIARITDFGLALAMDVSRLTQEGMMVGTYLYMPPEQALGGEVSIKADLYSLGAMLYEMVTGRPPFVGDDSVSIIGQHINTPPVSPTWHRANLPPAFESLIMLLLEKDPQKRPASARDVYKALESIEKSEIKESTVETLVTTESPLYRRVVFVGRENELKQLHSAFERAMSGQGSLMMVVGEPGIGKTAICEQLATFVTLRGGKTLWGHCYEEGSLSLPYLAFVEAIRSYVLDREPDDLKRELGSGATDVARIISEIREKLKVEPRPSENPEEDRYRLMQAVTSFLSNAANVKPMLVILEDLHDADKGTLDMLSYVSRNLTNKRLLIVGTYRDVEVDRNHPLSAALAELRRVSSFGRVLLRGLNIDEVRRMLTSITQEEVPMGLAEAVHRQTEGNPLFIQEVVRYLVEDGVLTRRDGRWHPTTDSALEMNIPEGLRDVIGKRLSLLSKECNQLLSVASVIGREFNLEILRAVTDVDEDSFVNALNEAVQLFVLEERYQVGRVHYRFTHAFFRQTLYEELIAPRRLRLHQQIARALESIYSKRLEEHATELAEHFSHSTDSVDLEKAVSYGEMAVKRATDVYAYGEAVRLLDQAINVQEILDPEDKVRRCDLLLALCDALYLVVNTRRILEVEAPAAFSLAESLGDGTRAVRACIPAILSIATEQVSLATPEAGEWAERTGRYAKPETVERAYADMGLGAWKYWTGERKSGLELLNQAVDLARRIGDQQALWLTSAIFLWHLRGPQHVEQRVRIGEELWAGSHAGLNITSIYALYWIIGTSLMIGRRKLAEEVWGELRIIAERTGNIQPWVISESEDAALAVMDGRLEDAMETAKSTRARGKEAGVSTIAYIFASPGHRAQLYLGASLETIGREIPVGPAEQIPVSCLVHALLGQKEETSEILEKNVVNRPGIGTLEDETAIWMDTLYLEAAVLVGHRQSAELLLKRLNVTDLCCPEFYPTCIPRHMGGAAALLEKYDEARQHYQEAIRVCTEMSFRPELALTRLQLAELFLEHYPQEKKEALEHLDFAIKEFREMKMQPSLERALRHKEILGA